MLVVSQRGYIFEETSLVASQLPLTREPRKECGARDSITFARAFRAELFGAMSGEESVERRLIVRWGAIPQSCDRLGFMYLNVGGVAKGLHI